MIRNLLWCTLLIGSVGLAQTIVGNPTGSQTITQPSGTMFNVNKLDQVRYADQFSGIDIGAKVNNAISDCISSGLLGCEVAIPAGNYSFSTKISINKNVILRGAGQGIADGQSGYGTRLVWTGSGGVAIEIIGNNRQATIRDFALDNTGTGSVGIDIDQNVSHVFVEHVTIYPQGTGFSEAAVRLGNTGNVVDVTLRDVYIRNNAVGISAHSVSAFMVLDHVRDVQNTSNDLILGDALNAVIGFHAINSTFEGGANTTSVLVKRAINASFSNCYFENDGTGYAIDISTPNAVWAWDISVSESYFAGAAFGHNTPYAIRLNFVSAYFTLRDSFLNGYTNGSAGILNTQSARLLVEGNDFDYSNAQIATSYTNAITISNSLAGVLDVNRMGIMQVRASICTSVSSGTFDGCNQTINWPAAWADTNYTVTCSTDTTSIPVFMGPLGSKTTTSFQISVFKLNDGTGVTTISGTIDCIGVHD